MLRIVAPSNLIVNNLYGKSYHIKAHLDPLTTLFLSIQDAPGMNPADPLGCLYLSIQIESVFLYGTRYENRTRLSALKGQRPYR